MLIKRKYKYAFLLMALLMVSVIGNAFGLSYWQDNRTRQRAAQNRNASAASRKQTAATTKDRKSVV